MPTTARAKVILYGEGVNPDDITTMIGLNPTKIHRMGEKRGRSSATFDADIWIIATDRVKTFSAEDQVSEILAIVEPYTEQIKKAMHEYKLTCEIASVMYIVGNDTPSLHLNNDSIKIMARLHAEFDIDIILFPDE